MTSKIAKTAAGLMMGAVSMFSVTAHAEELRIAVALPGLINDKSFNQNVYEGIERIKAEFGIDVDYTENVADPAQVEALSDYARRGYDVIIGAGGGWTDSAKRVAADFPDAQLVVLNGAPTEGVATINFENEQFGYVLGYAAAAGSQTGTIGALSAQQVPAFDQILAGYRAGAEAAKAGTQVLTAYTNDWADIAKAKEASLNMISQGADVILPYLDGAFMGVVQAAEEKSTYVVGVVADLSGPYPDQNMASTILDFGGALYMAIDLAQKGELESKDFRFGIGTEAGLLGGFNAALSDDVKAAIAADIERMKSGELTISVAQ